MYIERRNPDVLVSAVHQPSCSSNFVCLSNSPEMETASYVLFPCKKLCKKSLILFIVWWNRARQRIAYWVCLVDLVWQMYYTGLHYRNVSMHYALGSISDLFNYSLVNPLLNYESKKCFLFTQTMDWLAVINFNHHLIMVCESFSNWW